MDARIRKRVWREIKDVNADFFNLRTVIAPAPDDEDDDDGTCSKFYFAMCPNDGALAHVPIVGCLYIPLTDPETSRRYPDAPPVVHVYTLTGRYNVDVFHDVTYGEYANKRRSSMCFDILRSPQNGGTWRREYTLSLLFASLMAALVSFYVLQQGERNKELPEYVSMHKLESVKRGAWHTFEKYRHLLPPLPEIPMVEAKAVEAEELKFGETVISTTDGPATVVTAKATPIFLQRNEEETSKSGQGGTKYRTFAIDLSDLHSEIVFSVILSNKKDGEDLHGKKPCTILVRNGVTATAARKRLGAKTEWFYHGKPMNDGDMRLHVTIGGGQMTMAYYDSGTGKYYVHGDCPVSRLGKKQIGDVKGVPFWVHIFMQKKSGRDVKARLIDTEGVGYIHDAAGTGYGVYQSIRRKGEEDEAWSEVSAAESDSEFEVIEKEGLIEVVKADEELQGQGESGVARESDTYRRSESEVNEELANALSALRLGLDDD